MAAGAGQALGPAAADLRAVDLHRHRRRPGADPVQRVPRRRRTRGGQPGRDRPAAAGALPGLAGQPARRAEREGGLRSAACTCSSRPIRQHGWDDTLPTTAVFFTGDTPPRPPQLTRHLSEHVMAQVEAPANLDRWPHPEGRLITLILIRCGLRASDACTLAFDCLLHDGQGAPYLRYLNHKMRREAAVPIDDDLEAEIRAQQRRVAARWPEGTRHLFPEPPRQRRRAPPADLLQLPQHAQPLAERLRRPRRARPAGPPDPAPVATHLRHQADQPRRPAGSHPGPARPRVHPDDRALRPDHRPDRPPALGTGHQGQHQGRAGQHRPRRAAGPGRNGPRPATGSPPRPCRTATAGCPCRRAARTPTPA